MKPSLAATAASLLALALAGCFGGGAGSGSSTSTSTSPAADACPDMPGGLCLPEDVRCLRETLDMDDDGLCDPAVADAACSLPDVNDSGTCDESRLCLLEKNRDSGFCLVEECASDLPPAAPNDFDGDRLADSLERALTDRLEAFPLDYCVADSDDDGIPDGIDLVWQKGSGQGLEVELWLEAFYQYNDGIFDDPDCRAHMTTGGYMDDPSGDGDPWFATSSFLGTGNLVPGPGGGKAIAYHKFTYGDHYEDDECRAGMHEPLVGGAAALPEDVTNWVKNPLQGASDIFPAAFAGPSIGAFLLAFDDDGDCSHELYAVGELEFESCDGDPPIPQFVDLIDITWLLVGAPGSAASLAEQADADGLLRDACITHYGLRLCFTLQVTGPDGRFPNVCNLALVADVWQLPPGAVLDRDLENGWC